MRNVQPAALYGDHREYLASSLTRPNSALGHIVNLEALSTRLDLHLHFQSSIIPVRTFWLRKLDTYFKSAFCLIRSLYGSEPLSLWSKAPPLFFSKGLLKRR
jgi:hypothetical protein